MNRSPMMVLLLASATLFGGCAREEKAPGGQPPTMLAAAESTATAQPEIDFAAVAAAAVADPARPEADRAEDERRKPAAALAFSQVGPGLSVFEIEAGAGWYTELLSRLVGPGGSVVMQNPPGFRSFVGEQIEARLAGGRLSNVRESLSRFDALDAISESVDVVTWFQGPHDLYFTPGDGESLGDAGRSYAEIYRILKPGGVFSVIDHSALAGAPEAAGNDLHRVDRAIVVAMAKAAGFTLEAEGDFLADADDPRTISVFDPAIRGRTDQFALRFRKPHQR